MQLQGISMAVLMFKIYPIINIVLKVNVTTKYKQNLKNIQYIDYKNQNMVTQPGKGGMVNILMLNMIIEQ